MINLKAEIEQLIEQSIEFEKSALLDCYLSDLSWIDYHANNICKVSEDLIQFEYDHHYRMNDDQKGALLQFVFDTIQEDDSRLYTTSGYWARKGEIVIARSEEIGIVLPEHWRITEYKKAVINRRTDLYISDRCNEYGYTTSGINVCFCFNIVELLQLFKLIGG